MTKLIKMQKILVIYNPMAGSKKGGNLKKIILKTLEKKGYEYDFFETIKAEKQPFEKFAEKDYQKIIVCGGDGTVTEVVGFIIDNEMKSNLIIIPLGSANILALSLKISLDPKIALREGLEKKGQAVDAMKINKKYYGMIAVGLGYDALIMQQTTRSMKRKWGFFAYVWTTIKTIFTHRSQTYKVTIDNHEEKLLAKALITFNILPFGETKIARAFIGKKVLPDDGMLNIIALNPGKIFAKETMKVFSGKKIKIYQNAPKFHIDGDVHEGKTVNIEILPKIIHIAF